MTPMLLRSKLATWGFAAAVLCVVLHGAPLAAQDEDAMSVAEFVRQEPKWPRFQGTGTTLKVEGRWRILNDDRLLYTNCDLLFVMGDGVRVPTSRGKSVQVTGTLETRQGKLAFVVSRLKELPSDAETLADRRGRLPPDDAAAWYALGDWAEKRGKFYEDSELLTSAIDLRRAGIMIEYRQIGVADIPALYVLSQKVEKFGLPPALRDEIIHDALRRELRAARQRDAKQREVVLTHVLNRLPGAEISVPRDEAVLALERKYEEQPLEVYQQADDDQRRKLNRLIYARAMLERIELDAAEDGSNGFAIAGRIEESLPEHADKAKEYREREINRQIAHVSELTRDELQTLTSRLEERTRGDEATDAKRHWLAAREPEYRARGAGGLLDLAQETITLLDDADAAAAIYMEMFQDRAGQDTASARLVELGYEFDGSEWQKSTGGTIDATADAIRRGIVRKGMTAEQVRAAFGRPPSVVKFAVQGQVSELWVYPDHGVAIEFTRRGAEAANTAVQVSELAGP